MATKNILSVFPRTGEMNVTNENEKLCEWSHKSGRSVNDITHPVICELQSRGLTDKDAAKILDISVSDYHQSKSNPETARTVITADKILHLCHEWGMHPASLVERSMDFLTPTPTEIIQANIWVAQTSGYTEQDKSLARYALRREQERYRQFMNDPSFGRLGELLEEAIDEMGTKREKAIAATVFPYKPHMYIHTIFMIHAQGVEKMCQQNEQESNAIKKAIEQKALKFIFHSKEIFGEQSIGREFKTILSSSPAPERAPAEQMYTEEKYGVKKMIEAILYQDINRIYSVCEKKFPKSRHTFLLGDDADMLVEAFYEYQALRSGKTYPSAILKVDQEAIEDKKQVIDLWRSVLNGKSEISRSLERLLANQAMIRMTMRKRETAEDVCNGLWKKITTAPV